MPRLPVACGSDRANTTNRSASGAFVMKRLVPSRTQCAPSRRAVVRRPDGSDPASDSVRANEAMSFPSAIGGRNSARRSGSANFAIIWPAIPLFVPNRLRNAGAV